VFEDGAYRLVSRRQQGLVRRLRCAGETLDGERCPSVPELHPEMALYIGDSSAPTGSTTRWPAEWASLINVGDALLEVHGTAHDHPASAVPANDRPDDHRERRFEKSQDERRFRNRRPMLSSRFSGPSSGSTFPGPPPSRARRRQRLRPRRQSLARTGPGTRLQRSRSRPCRMEVTRPFCLRSRSVHVLLDGIAVDPWSSRTLGKGDQMGAECSMQQFNRRNLSSPWPHGEWDR
jgi:hypothetical protein